MLVIALGSASAQDDSTHARVNDPAPRFALPALDGSEVDLDALRGKVVVLEWIATDCPYVAKHHTSGRIAALVDAFQGQGVVWLSIASGRAADPDRLRAALGPMRIDNPVLLDRTGCVARRYVARTTPQVFVIDAEGVLRYSGAVDDDASRWSVGSTNYVELAVKALLAGDEVPVPSTLAYGSAVDR